jgi:hypothetical protein
MGSSHPEQKGTKMRSRLRWPMVTCIVAALALTASACGDDDGDDGGDGAPSASETGIPEQYAAPTEAPDDAQEGGDVTVLATDDVDYMDPGAAYYQFTYMVTSASQRALLSWRPPDVAEPVPDLAEEEP